MSETFYLSEIRECSNCTHKESEIRLCFFSLLSFLQIMLCNKIDYWHSKPVSPENEGFKKRKLNSRDTTTPVTVISFCLSAARFSQQLSERGTDPSVYVYYVTALDRETYIHTMSALDTETYIYIYIYK